MIQAFDVSVLNYIIIFRILRIVFCKMLCRNPENAIFTICLQIRINRLKHKKNV